MGLNPNDPQLRSARYTGRYSLPGLGELDVKIVEGRLVAVIPEAPPGSDITFIPEGEDTFRMKGGPAHGERAIFGRDAAGAVTQLKAGSFILQRQ